MSRLTSCAAAAASLLCLLLVAPVARADDKLTPVPAGSEKIVADVAEKADNASYAVYNRSSGGDPTDDGKRCMAAVDVALKTLPPTTEVHVAVHMGRAEVPGAIIEIDGNKYHAVSLAMVQRYYCLPAFELVRKVDNAAMYAANWIDRLDHADASGKVENLITEDDVNGAIGDATKCQQAVDDARKAGYTDAEPIDANIGNDSSVKTPLTLGDVGPKVCKVAADRLAEFQVKRLEALDWPKEAKVAKAAALKKATLAWWTKHNQDVPPASRVAGAKVLAAAITDDWTSGSKDDFDRTTRWDLPVWVAVTNDTLKAQGYAMVYQCWMVTKEKHNAKAALPFDTSVVGTPFRFKLAKVPKK